MNTVGELLRENDILYQSVIRGREKISSSLKEFDKWCDQRRQASDWTTLGMVQLKVRELFDEKHESTKHKHQNSKKQIVAKRRRIKISFRKDNRPRLPQD